MRRKCTYHSSSSSTYSSIPASKKYTFIEARTLTVKHSRHINELSDSHVKDLFTGDILFFKRVPSLYLYSSSIITRVGTNIPWPGHLIYRVHSASSLDSHMLRRLRHSRSSGGRLFQRLGGYRRWARNVLFISDARNGAVMYTLQMKRKRWSVESRMSYFRSIFKFISNDDNNDHKNIRNNLASTEDIAIWKGPSTSGRPYLILSGLLHDMNFDIFTTTTTTSNTQQQQQRRRKRKRGGGSVVGVVSKDLFDKREALRDNGRYGVHVQPGYDCALFVLLAIIVDELFNHHHPGSISEKAYESLVGSGPRCGGQETTAVTHKGMETTTTATDRTESLISAEEESIPMSLGFSLIMTSSSCGESFSDIEDRMREKASLLEEHLMYRSGSLS